MKVLFVVCLAIAMTYADWRIQTADDLGGYRTQCVSDLHIPAEKVENFKRWQFEDGDACYIECIMSKMGLFEAEKGYNVENLVEQLGQNTDKADVRTKVEKCADNNPNKDDKCKWAFRGFMCFQTNNLRLIQASVKKN